MEVKQKYYELKKNNPNIDKQLVEDFIKNMPEIAMATLDKIEYGSHIVSNELAEKGISYIKNNSGELIGAKWTADEVMTVAKNYINIDEEDFYELDLYVWANVKYGDYAHIVSEPTLIVRMAIEDLKDDDYPKAPDERAYCWVIDHIKE